MPADYAIRAMDPHSTRELEAVTCFSVMTIWESRPELRADPRKTPGYSWSETHARLRAGIRSADQRYLVATDAAENLVGTSIVVLRTDDHDRRFGYFWSRYVLPSARRQGISARFQADALAWFRTRGAAYAEVHVHPQNGPLQAQYTRSGFVQAGRGADPVWSWVVFRADL